MIHAREMGLTELVELILPTMQVNGRFYLRQYEWYIYN